MPHPETADMGRIEMTATGPWVETILWEVPLMASLSEMYFLTTDRDWSYEGQEGELMQMSKDTLSQYLRGPFAAKI